MFERLETGPYFLLQLLRYHSIEGDDKDITAPGCQSVKMYDAFDASD